MRLAGPRALTLGCLFGLLFWAVLLFATAIWRSHSYELHGFRWATSTVGYTAPPSVLPYVDAGMAQWASESGFHPVPGGSGIRVVIGEMLPPVYYPEQPAQSNVLQVGGVIFSCEIRLHPVHFFALPPSARQNTVTHEIGHCLGINHSSEPSVMANPLFFGWTVDDSAAGRAVMPYPYQVIVPIFFWVGGEE